MTNETLTPYGLALEEIRSLQKRVLELELDKRALEEENAELKRKSCIISIDSLKVEE